ncbi:TPA_asm: hypothetical protein [Physarum slime mold MELD virus]|nr:TPA_asm: hypothetical protein [Physarum slime mold MELD virus]
MLAMCESCGARSIKCEGEPTLCCKCSGKKKEKSGEYIKKYRSTEKGRMATYCVNLKWRLKNKERQDKNGGALKSPDDSRDYIFENIYPN